MKTVVVPAVSRGGRGFLSGVAIGALGGLVGLGGAEFRLPLLVAMFGLRTLEAVVFNKAMSLVVVVAALAFRTGGVPSAEVWAHLPVVLNLLAGSLVGAWWAAGRALRLPGAWLDRLVMAMLLGLALVMLAEGVWGLETQARPLFEDRLAQWACGLLAGLLIGVVAALLGVAGGELLIPTIVLLYGVDIKLAGSLSLMVSLPTMLVGFARYAGAPAFAVLGRERALFWAMAGGSVLGAALGALLLGAIPARLLLLLLGVILLVSALKTFLHRAR